MTFSCFTSILFNDYFLNYAGTNSAEEKNIIGNIDNNISSFEEYWKLKVFMFISQTPRNICILNCLCSYQYTDMNLVN